jgi:hypothetical protein
LIAALGIAMHIALNRVVLRTMVSPDAESALVPVFRTAGFIGVGLAMAVELIAIVTTFFGAPLWVIALGAAISISGLWRIAPSQRVFRSCDARLQAQGKAIRMTDAWRRPSRTRHHRHPSSSSSVKMAIGRPAVDSARLRAREECRRPADRR